MIRRILLPAVALALAASPLAAQRYHGFNPRNMDTSVRPCEDFYRYALGTWEKNTAIPAEYASYGVDQEIEERSFAILKEILESAAADKTAASGSERQKVGDYFASGMDVTRIEQDGLKPLAGRLARIDQTCTGRSLAETLAAMHQEQFSPAFRFRVEQDDKDSEHYIVQLAQGGLGLPEREYYLKTDAKSAELRTKYQAHIAKNFQFLGDPPTLAAAHAKTVVALETRLAKASGSTGELRGPEDDDDRSEQEHGEKQDERSGKQIQPKFVMLQNCTSFTGGAPFRRLCQYGFGRKMKRRFSFYLRLPLRPARTVQE